MLDIAILPSVIAPALPAPEPLFPSEIIETTQRWLRELSLAWRQEVPLQLHTSEVDPSGSPQFHHAFAAYIERDCRRPDCHDLHCNHGQDRPNPRKRANKAIGKLRRVAPREFDAVFLHVAHQMTMSDIARALTERAERLGKPEVYDETSILVLVVSGVDKIQRWY